MTKNTKPKMYLLAAYAMACSLCLVATAQQQIQPQQQQQQQQLVPVSLPLNGQIGAPVLQATNNCTLATTKPAPLISKYALQNCIVLQFATYLSVGQGQYVELNNGHVNTNLSSCDDGNLTDLAKPRLVIDFPCAQLAIQISKNNSQIYVQGIAGTYTTDSTTVEFHNTSILFKTSQADHYYKCNAAQTINLSTNASTPIGVATMEVSNFALEAFRNVNGTDFYKTPEDCPLDSQPVSDLVRIGVGVCLVALVAIVLVAYFVGRRRWSERSSYESV